MKKVKSIAIIKKGDKVLTLKNANKIKGGTATDDLFKWRR